MFLSLLESHIKKGTLHLHLADGEVHTFGAGLPEVDWVIHRPDTMKRIASDPELMLGETYMNGEWDVGEKGDLTDLIDLLVISFPEQTPHGVNRWLQAGHKLLQQWNRLSRSLRNVAHHYDLDEWLFRHFLDADMQYSCAYFESPEMSLEEAQQAKCRHIMNKLLLRPGQKVLDIGCGWGGTALYLAENAGVKVTGLTLSKEQLRVANKRARARGLDRLVEFRLEDYRKHRGEYDRIVSIGMFEHVGRPQYKQFFRQLNQLLKPEGVSLLHTIGCFVPPGNANAWLERHIFPGSDCPLLSDIHRAVENNSLVSTDIEVWRVHYARTLDAWLQRFRAHRDEIAAMKGEEFCRMWEFYLVLCRAGFHWRKTVVFHLQIAHDILGVPFTRDYLYDPDTRNALQPLQPAVSDQVPRDISTN